jgi:adenosylcobyric acid synthase
VVGDIDRGGVFASVYGTVKLLPDELRARVAGFVINRLRGDPTLLGSACDDLAARIGVPCLGVLPMLPGTAFDAEDSLALDHPDEVPDGEVLDVATIRWPLVANAGDVDPLRLEPRVHVRWVRSVAELGRPDLVFLPGSKSTLADLEWFRSSGLASAVERLSVPVVAVCAGLQMAGELIDDPDGVEGAPGRSPGLGWLPVTSAFVGDKVLDRPVGRAVDGPGAGSQVAGYRIHHGRVRPTGAADANGTEPWLVADDDSVLGWHRGHLCGTTLHGLFEDDGFRSGVLRWAAAQVGKQWSPSGVSFAATRTARLDAIADALETHLDLDALGAIISSADPEDTTS